MRMTATTLANVYTREIYAYCFPEKVSNTDVFDKVFLGHRKERFCLGLKDMHGNTLNVSNLVYSYIHSTSVVRVPTDVIMGSADQIVDTFHIMFLSRGVDSYEELVGVVYDDPYRHIVYKKIMQAVSMHAAKVATRRMYDTILYNDNEEPPGVVSYTARVLIGGTTKHVVERHMACEDEEICSSVMEGLCHHIPDPVSRQIEDFLFYRTFKNVDVL